MRLIVDIDSDIRHLHAVVEIRDGRGGVHERFAVAAVSGGEWVVVDRDGRRVGGPTDRWDYAQERAITLATERAVAILRAAPLDAR